MKSSEHWYFACYYGLLWTRGLCLFLWTDQNPTTLHAFMKSSEACLFACFYELIWIQHIWLFLWTGFLPFFMKSSEPWFFACFSALTWIGWIAKILSCFYAWNLGTLHLCLILWTAQNPACIPTIMKSSEPWFFAFYGLLPATYNIYSSELTCIGCIAQIPSWFYAWKSVPSLLGTLESLSALLGTLISSNPLCQIQWTVLCLLLWKALELWCFDCFYGLLRTWRLCLFLWTDRNPTTLHAFMKS